ncbi:VanW family protein [Virgibacillus sp. 179-BFC.A HS]|uniref:VanW family protein n=1 Tax=Tigheibacillus jepli TaxID=3035914 RepID=A0ABU5CJF4_9BACI|nr:VanW family protein [Virgibacillus sp. 179-BFC.A HS]MDY0406061.1 VanW family protein [Virgibacillus sp. 179-BFC.A HS]
MKKITWTGVIVLCIFLWPQQSASAQTSFIVRDKNMSETILRDDFSLPATNHMFMDMHKFRLLLKRLGEQVYEKPINASLDERMEIIPEKAGNALDTERFVQAFQQFFYTNKSNNIVVPKKVIYPKVDSELLANISTTKIKSYSTFYKPGNKERSHNISLAIKAINNQVVIPGETFSFNKIVGKRTKERGYKRAPVIVRGELSEDIGGGICQVSSTLFNAVHLNGIQIVERYSHSRKVPYVPPGKDATVSWWGPDFVFKNNYKQPILVRAHAANGRVTVAIYASDSLQ